MAIKKFELYSSLWQSCDEHNDNVWVKKDCLFLDELHKHGIQTGACNFLDWQDSPNPSDLLQLRSDG